MSLNKDNKRRFSEDSLIKRYLYKLLTNSSAALMGIFTVFIVPRTLGPAQYGQFDFVTNHFTLVIKTLMVSIPEGFFNWVSKKGKKEDLNGPFGRLMLFFYSCSIILIFVHIFNIFVRVE